MEKSQLIQKLVELDIYDIAETEYDENGDIINNNRQNLTVVDSDGLSKNVNTNNLTNEDVIIDLLAQNVILSKSIKSMLKFFVVTTITSIVLGFLLAMNLSQMF